MKHIIPTFAISLCVLLTSCISTNPKVLRPLADQPDSEAIYLNKGFLTIAGRGSDSEIIKKIKSIEVVTCENAGRFQDFDSLFNKIVTERNMELLVETSEPKEAVEIYAISSKKSEVVKEILIKCIEPSECSVVYMKGNFPVAELIEHPEDLIN